MELSQYQELSFNAVPDHIDVKDAMLHWTVGLAEEAGEVAGAVKHKYYCKEYVSDYALAEEIGDVLWYLSALCTSAGLSLETVAELNIAKLQQRYPTGEFDPEKSAARHQEFEKFQSSKTYSEILSKIYLKNER